MNSSSSIFIADDNEINRLLLQSQLEDQYKNLTFAADGKIALNYLQHYKFDLILLDIQMPYFSGLELIKIIKQQDSFNQNTPVIAITAQLQSEQQKALISAQFDECLIKPILLDQLNELLSLWLPVTNIKTPSIEVDYVSSLVQKSSGNIVLATTIFNKLFSELPEQSLLIDQAIKANELELALEITHKLHGSVSFCGFTDMQVLANALEVSLLEKENYLISANFNLLKNKITDFILQKQNIFKQIQAM